MAKKKSKKSKDFEFNIDDITNIQLPSFVKTLASVVMGFLLFVVLILAAKYLYGLTMMEEGETLYSKTEYHTVYMDNDLFYFCKIKDYNKDYIACNEAYYLVRKEVEGEEGESEKKVFIRQPEDEELYKPEGPIYLKKDKITYIAKISDDSPVYEYIENTEE